MSVARENPRYNLILALEASGDAVSVALIKRGGYIAFKQHKARFGHAEYLVDMVHDVMEEADAVFSDLTFIVAGCGPGSFTGLRLCLSAAKGYVLATTASALGVNGLAALALDAIQQNQTEQKLSGRFICFANTRRNSLFTQQFDSQAKMISPIQDVPFAQISTYIEEAYLCYDGEPLTLIGHVGDLPEMKFTEKNIRYQQKSIDAKMIARYAIQSLSSPQLYKCFGLEPLYVVAPKLGPIKG